MPDQAQVSKQPSDIGSRSLLVEAIPRTSARVAFTIDGQPAHGWQGQSILVAVLLNGDTLRRNEFSGEARAGFCVMGACQDCWVWLGDGGRVRACTTPLTEGMAIWTRAPESFPRHG